MDFAVVLNPLDRVHTSSSQNNSSSLREPELVARPSRHNEMFSFKWEGYDDSDSTTSTDGYSSGFG